MIDYKELLLKYIHHVGEEEGFTYIYKDLKPDNFTQEEWKELARLDNESMSRKLELEVTQ